MIALDLEKDILPLSEFRADAAGLIERARNSQRALVLTQRGRSTAVVLDVAAYQRLLNELESFLRDVQISLGQLDEGQGVPHREAKRIAIAKLHS